MFGPLNVFRSLPEASSTHSATAQQSPQGSSMKGLCAVVGIGTTAVLHSVLTTHPRVQQQLIPWFVIQTETWQAISNQNGKFTKTAHDEIEMACNQIR